MKNYSAYSFTALGYKIGEKLERHFPLRSGKDGLEKESRKIRKKEQIAVEHFYYKNEKGGIKARLAKDFLKKDGLIFICSTGIAVRMLKDLINKKTTDPAVIVIDDTARFVIPLLSGHLGGANAGAELIAKFLKAQPVITTASDNRKIEAVDMFSKRCGYTIESMPDAKTVTALMVDGKKIGFYSEEFKTIKQGEKKSRIIKYGNLEILSKIENMQSNLSRYTKDNENISAIIAVSADPVIPNLLRKAPLDIIPHVILIPRTLNLGIGLRKGVPKETVKEAAELALLSVGKTLAQAACAATIELKKNEKGLLDFIKELNIPLVVQPIEKIRLVEHLFKASGFVKKTTGVSSVSAPCAYLLGSKIILEKFEHKGVTISISQSGN